MVDEYTEVEEVGCFSQLKESIKGIGTGAMMILIAFTVMFWNECRAVDRAEDLEFGKGAVVSVESDKVDKANTGELIHVTGEAKTGAPLVEPDMGFEASALQLKRDVEIYQWVEDKKTKTKKKNGKKVKKTTYSYEKEWVDSPVDSSNFNKSGYTNKGQLPFESTNVTADDATLGDYDLPPRFINKIPDETSLKLTDDKLAKLPSDYAAAKTSGDWLYLQGDAAKPFVGDVRVSYSVVEPGPLTIIAGQEGSAFTPYTHPDMNGDIAMVEMGTLSANKMFKQAEEANATMTWIIRVVGWLMMMGGFGLLFGPIDVIADVVPIVGGIVDFGTNIAAAILGTGITFVTIALGWVVARPLLGIGMLVIGLGAIGGLVFLALKAKGDGEQQPAQG
ncbi:MAG: TMEM43 family protein [Myxococcota bacterium]